ncbi:MAG: SGNH/GDSL hydrolase family protein [Bacteroidota bacterium]
MLNIPIQSSAQALKEMKYFDEDSFLLEGTEIADSLKENRYDRLPLAYKELVREPVWNLSKSSAGLSIRFLSNSSSISVKWKLLKNARMNHMAETGIKGVDLYFNNDGTWQYLNTARPSGIENEFMLIDNMSNEMREYKMFLPLYDGVESIEVGIDVNSVIKKPAKNNNKPIIFYGTSITQGGCASRPGMVHTNIISRKLKRDCINFGFSGNGRMEQPINELIAGFDPLFYVIECLPNMTAEQITNRTIPLVKTIRQQHPETPIIFVENFIYEMSALNRERAALVQGRNKALKTQYAKIMEDGYQNILYINSENATGTDHEGTVDGVHFTDLGFIRYADFLIDQFVQFGLIMKKE